MAFGGWSSVRMVQRYTRASHERMLELHGRRESAGHDRDTEEKAGGQPKS